MKHLDLFSGIGGFALACQWAVIETIGFVEIDKYCQKVLRKHWPNVPIVEDIRDVEKIKEIVANATKQPERESHNQGGSLSYPRNAWLESTSSSSRHGDIPITESNGQSPAILVTAGFPCQPFSVAGKREGTEDDRYLWPETLTVIKAIKPRWILLENVAGIINLALDTVLSDLEGAGYSYETLIIPACAVNAWHRRDRIWIIAFSEQSTSRRGRFPRDIGDEGRQTTKAKREGLQSTDGAARPDNLESGSQDVAFTESIRQRPSRDTIGNTIQRKNKANFTEIGSREIPIADTEGNGIQGRQSISNEAGSRDWWAVESRLGGMVDELSERLDGYFDTEPDIPRVATGVKNRVDRLKCLGNAIVPPLAYEIIKVIKEYEGQT